MALSTAKLAVALDAALAGIGFVEWSEDGATVSSKVAATAVALGAATVANPSVKSNSEAIESAPVSAAGTFSHFRFTTLATGGVAGNDFVALSAPVVVAQGGTIKAAAGALKEQIAKA